MSDWWFVSREYVDDAVRLLEEEGYDERARSLLTFHRVFLEEREPDDLLVGYLIKGSRVQALVIFNVNGYSSYAELVDIEEWLATNYYYDPDDP